MKPKYLNIKNNQAYLRDISLEKLATHYQTPLMVFDEVELRENIKEYTLNFVSKEFKTTVVYASKAFLAPALLNILTEYGLWMDAVSMGDLYIAKMSGFKMEHVIFHGNNKSDEELTFAANLGCIIVVDHLDELKRLVKITNGKNALTMFRVNPGISAHTHKYIQTSTLSSKFGESMYDDLVIDEIMKVYKENPHINLLGFHSHIGSQIHEIEPFIMNVDKMMEFSLKVINKYQYPLETVNFGGGFGIPYIKGEQAINKKDCLKAICKRVEELGSKCGFMPKNIFIEPGRSILGNACVTLYTCGDVKHTYGKTNYLFIDGGMTDNIRPALYEAEYECDIISKMNDEKNETYSLAGKCCESGDIIIHNASLPKASRGDIVVVYATGAYTYAMASNYNNMLKPEVVFVNDDVKVVCKRERLEDLMHNFVD